MFAPTKRTRVFFLFSFGKPALLTLLLALAGGLGYAQDPDFSLFNSSPQYNPAHVGYTEYSRFTLGYRSDFPSYTSSFTTYAAAFDTYFPEAKSGVGIFFMSDQLPASVFKTNTLTLAYSFSIKLGDQSFASLGLQGTYQALRYDPSKLVFFDMINPGGVFLPNQAPYEVKSANNFNVGGGIAASINRLSFGAAALNLSQTLTQSLYSSELLPDPLRINAYLTYDFLLGEERDPRMPAYEMPIFDLRSIVITPSLAYNRQLGLQQLSAGVNATFGATYAGLVERQDLSFSSISVMLYAGVKYDRYALSFGGEIATIGTGGRGVINSAIELNLSVQLWDNDWRSNRSGASGSRSNGKRKVRTLEGYELKKRKRYYR